MSHFATRADRERAFRSVYTEVYPDVLRFIQRRTTPDQAEDVAAEVFLVVWRRQEDLPRVTGEARAWIFGVARNVLLNAQRAERRRDALGIRLADPTLQPSPAAGTDGVIGRVDLAQAWRWLSARDQEAIALAVFDKLTSTQAAQILDISPVAFRLRLSRARRSLRQLLTHPRRATARAAERTTTS